MNDPAKMTLQEWLDRAAAEYALSRVASTILNKTDVELEAGFRQAADPEKAAEAALDMVEHFASWIEAYKGGVEVLEIASKRLIVITERLAGRERMEACYREGAS